jgi:hypothetical protein
MRTTGVFLLAFNVRFDYFSVCVLCVDLKLTFLFSIELEAENGGFEQPCDFL